MSVGSTLRRALGIVMGIFIPGSSTKSTNLTHTVQQALATAYGEAARDLAARLKLDTTGMSGPDKVFAITRAIVATAQRDGFKGDAKVLGDVALDVAQAAYRASEPHFGEAIVALASSLTSNPLILAGAELVGDVVQAVADRSLAPAAA